MEHIEIKIESKKSSCVKRIQDIFGIEGNNFQIKVEKPVYGNFFTFSPVIIVQLFDVDKLKLKW